MKILFFIESLNPGGKERRLVELIKGLSKYPDVEMQLVLMNKEIHYKDIIATGIEIHYTPRKYFKKDPSVFFQFYKKAKNFKPDIIHVWGNMVAIYAIVAKVMLKIPMVNNQITSAPTNVSSSLFGHKIPFYFSDKIVANSYAGLKSFSAPKYKSSVIYNGFDFDRIENLQQKEVIKRALKINTKYVVGMVASYTNKKDYDTYIKAATIILDEEKDITFLCIGSGDYENFKEMVDPENAENILFLGKQEKVENIMKICDIGVLCTFTEGISNSILEFMALNKPVIVSGEGGCSELVFNNKNGFLLDIGDFKEVANKINYLIKNENVRRNFGEASHMIVQEEFSISNMIGQFRMLYKEVMN